MQLELGKIVHKAETNANGVGSSVPVVASATPSSREVGGFSIGKVVLVCVTVLVDALAPLLQDHAARTAGFESSFIVLAETMSYYVGGLILGGACGGLTGLQRCMKPSRYLAFLPAAVAFNACNFLTYVAVRGFGASQFYLLVQLRVAVIALFLRFWSGVQQSTLAWLSLIQLAFGMVVLVWAKTNAGIPCGASSASGAAGNDVPRLALGEMSTAAAALVGVVLTSAFGFIYFEWQLKASSQDPLFVQLHQMNSFGAVVSVLIYVGQNSGALGFSDEDVTLASHSVLMSASASGSSPNSTSENGSDYGAAIVTPGDVSVLLAESDARRSTLLRLTVLLLCIVARGVLTGCVLKQLDSIAKGLIDVTAIVLCTVMQIATDGAPADGTMIGIQLLLLLSVVSFIVSRSSPSQISRKTYDIPEGAERRGSAPKIL